LGNPTELVHRDVSPQNVLVGIDGISRITDFGVARAQSRLTSTRTGQLKGKIAYMAPEQASGKEGVDRRADVFSSGILLWEVLAARRLFKAENEAATLSRVISEPITKLSSITSDVTPQISAVCMKALERDPDKRFSTCAQLADALERASLDKVASGREVSIYVSGVLGQEISQQREAVRTWLARSEPSQVGRPEMLGRHALSMPPSSSVSAAAMSLPRGEGSDMMSHPMMSGVASTYPQVRDSKRVLIAIAACLAALLVGASMVLLFTAPARQATLTQPSDGPAESPPAAALPAAAALPHPAPEVAAAQPSQLPTEAPKAAASSSSGAVRAGRAESAADEPPPRSRPIVRRSAIAAPRAAPAARSPEPAEKPERRPEDVNLSNPYR
ncbi:MAG TPA: serine/threonine-protein kinase, partial [Polyangiaceae bacterium]|nr:serine/threonine-protein kinase [Polyangiaceae bacterium]